jgi:signal transduction histidine kinase
VKEIITQHGGSVEVQSDEGKGATFHIRLPLMQPSSIVNGDERTSETV